MAEDDPRLAGYDVCIIGSGAGGSVLAYRLVERGKKVLLVERGEYMTPDRFTENEVEMIKHLYADGVFQQTEDFRFTILQGSCVGGSTVVNNAVCFEPPARVLDAWNDSAIHDAGLSRAGIDRSIQAVRSLIGVERQPTQFLNQSGARIAAAAAADAPDLTVNTVEANVHDCRGCGYCNIGCAYGKKLSMLDRVLPEAQKRFPGKLTILANAPVTRLLSDGRRPARILGARVTVAGPKRDRKLTIRAEKYVVSAGTVASSYLLMRSGIGRDLPVGKQMSFNMGSPLTADFPDNVESFNGLQISHFMAPPEQRGFVAETWFNPPVAQALNMPGWFEDHFRNMRRFSHLGAVGILVGTENTAVLREAATGGPGVTYTPSARDLYKLADGMAQMAGVFFKAGAERVLLNTWRYDVLTHPNQIGNIYRIAEDPRNLTLGTGHPQGGNGLSRDPRRGVIDDQFRVHGTTNLHVCDASVFPSSLTVNPQFTVMTLADYAAPMI
jgi:choline dehydrogenase-like flavoprotein